MLNAENVSEMQSVVGTFHTMEEVNNAIERLNDGGFPITQISVIASNLETEKDVHGFVTTGEVAGESAVTGAWVGGLFGILMGAAFIWVPGFGPLIVAGPFAAALMGGLEGSLLGAAAGGLLGALSSWGISKEHIVKYEEHVKNGDYLLIAHGTAEEVATASHLLNQ